MNLVNCGRPGISNDTILDIMIKNFEDINEGDYVILGRTLHQRFDVKDHRTDKLSSVIPENINNFNKISNS